MRNKSSTLLDLSEKELQTLSDSLKRAIVRLTTVAKGDNAKINSLLDEIKRNVKDKLDLTLLDAELDELFMLIKKLDIAETAAIAPAIAPAIIQEPVAHNHLKSAIKNYDFSSIAATYKVSINGLIDGDLSEDALSKEILQLIDKMGGEINALTSATNDQHKAIGNFQHDIRKTLSLNAESNKNLGTKAILDELAKEISNQIKPDNSHTKTGVVDIESPGKTINLLDSFILLLDSLETASADKKNKDELIKVFSSSAYDAESWKTSIKKLAQLINNDICLLQQDKNDLSDFVNMFSMQLSDIESYVEQTRIDREDTTNNAVQLRKSLDLNVRKIQNEVGIADNLSRLKENVKKHLDNIKETISRHKKQEVETEKILTGKYDLIMKELVQSKEQTESLQEQLDESRKKLLRDALTGVPNRLAYNERIITEVNRWKRTKEPLCLAMWDLDHFKNINDTYGHDAGDRVLKLFAKIILGRVRKVDLFVRMGGEEFLLMMPSTAISTALALNNKLLVILEKYKFHYQGELCPVTASVGIAEFEAGLDDEVVLKRADKALYISKNSGRNRCTVFRAG